MSALSSALSDHLLTFVEPQTEQLSIKMEPIRCGLYGMLPDALGEGFLWTVPLGDDCLVSMHSLRLKRPLVLEERPTDFSCIFSGSRATYLSLPGVGPDALADTENLAAFSWRVPMLTSERRFGRRIARSSSEPKPSSPRASPSLSRRNPSHASCT